MDFGVGQYDSRFGDVLNRVLGPAALARQPADATRQMIALQCFDVFNVERVEIEIVETKQSQRIVDFESENKSSNEICGFL